MYFRQYAKGSPYPTTQTVLDSDYDDEDDSDMYDELLGPKVVPIDHNHSIEIIENDQGVSDVEDAEEMTAHQTNLMDQWKNFTMDKDLEQLPCECQIDENQDDYYAKCK